MKVAVVLFGFAAGCSGDDAPSCLSPTPTITQGIFGATLESTDTHQSTPRYPGLRMQVTDADGAPVVLEVSDDHGFYQVALPPGHYGVAIEGTSRSAPLAFDLAAAQLIRIDGGCEIFTGCDTPVVIDDPERCL